MPRIMSEAVRLAAVELAIGAIADRIDWKARPPADPTAERLAILLPPTDVAELELKMLDVQAQMYTLLGLGG
jgi:hypothetical protein